MGNWRTVSMKGSLNTEDAKKVNDYLSLDFRDDNWGCLHNGGGMGLPNWGQENIDCTGNLGERGYDEDDVAMELEKIAEFAPSLSLQVHLGGDYESKKCVKTILLQKGNVQILDPLVDLIGVVPGNQMLDNFLKQLNK